MSGVKPRQAMLDRLLPIPAHATAFRKSFSARGELATEEHVVRLARQATLLHGSLGSGVESNLRSAFALAVGQRIVPGIAGPTASALPGLAWDNHVKTRLALDGTATARIATSHVRLAAMIQCSDWFRLRSA